jgi:hypothetical protein
MHAKHISYLALYNHVKVIKCNKKQEKILTNRRQFFCLLRCKAVYCSIAHFSLWFSEQENLIDIFFYSEVRSASEKSEFCVHCVHRSSVRLIDGNAKFSHLKNWPVKGLCGRCLSVWGPKPLTTPPPPLHLYTVYLFTQRLGGGGGGGFSQR